MSRSGFPFAVASSTVAGAVAAAGVLIGCGPGPLPLAPGPDVDALVAKYQAPTGTIEPQQIDDVIADAQGRLSELGLDWLPEFLAQSMTRLRKRLDDNGLPNDPSVNANLNHPRIDASVRLTQTCNGWTFPPGSANAAQNGTISVTAVVENSVLRRTLAAAGSNCHARVQPTNQIVVDNVPDLEVFVDAGISFYFYGPVPTTVAETNALVQLMGQVGTSTGGTFSGELDFVLDYPHVEVSLERSDGNIILEVGLDGVAIRAANATYRCDTALQTCGPM